MELFYTKVVVGDTCSCDVTAEFDFAPWQMRQMRCVGIIGGPLCQALQVHFMR